MIDLSESGSGSKPSRASANDDDIEVIAVGDLRGGSSRGRRRGGGAHFFKLDDGVYGGWEGHINYDRPYVLYKLSAFKGEIIIIDIVNYATFSPLY
jgi:hypothetical protein